MRFSEYFSLGKTQYELDFVDIPLDTDLPVFIDPYAISKRDDLFSAECNQIIVNFFQQIIDDIRGGNFDRAKYNLKMLGEPNETHLGLSRSNPQGRGIGPIQSIDVFDRLKASKAISSGMLKDLSDCELVIPGISRDKISDMVTNIVKSKIIEYTEQQCVTYKIKTERISSGVYWDPVLQSWETKYFDLPIFNFKPLLLVPKALVRRSIEFNHEHYYNGFVLEYLQQVHIDSNTSLVHLLKNGSRKVFKKELKEVPQYKLSKEFLYQFSEEHPAVLARYIASLPESISEITNEELEKKQSQPKDFNIDQAIENLQLIPSGNTTADDYHKLIIGILESIFYPNLIIPTKEEKIHDGRKRIDITYYNAARTGFLNYISHHIPCPFVIVECKNYSEDPGNPEFDQLSGRFSPNRGKFGILVCRTIADKQLVLNRCKDTCTDDRGYIIVLDDNDIIDLMKMRKEKNDAGINKFFLDRYKELVK